MDVWHWTSLVALLAYAGLSAIPDAYYQAAKIDGASALGGLPLHPAAEDEARAHHRDPAALHGQLHDLHGGVRADRRRAGQRDDVPLDRPRQDRARPVRPRPGGGDVADLLPDHPAAVVDLLHGDDAGRGRRDEAPQAGSCRRSTSCSCCCRSTGSSACRSRPPTRSSAASRSGRRTSRSRTTARSSPTRPGTAATSTRSSTWSSTRCSRCRVALPAAYAFSRYRFLGDKHLFFWLLTNRMAPAAVFALPFFQLYSAVGLFDTHIAVALAHCLFNVPLAVWILEGFMSGVPKRARRDRLSRRLLASGSFFRILPADASPPASAWRPSSASCSRGSSCCSPRP